MPKDPFRLRRIIGQLPDGSALTFHPEEGFQLDGRRVESADAIMLWWNHLVPEPIQNICTIPKMTQ